MSCAVPPLFTPAWSYFYGVMTGLIIVFSGIVIKSVIEDWIKDLIADKQRSAK